MEVNAAVVSRKPTKIQTFEVGDDKVPLMNKCCLMGEEHVMALFGVCGAVRTHNTMESSQHTLETK